MLYEFKKVNSASEGNCEITCGVNAKTSCDLLFDKIMEFFLRFVDINRYLIACFMYRLYLDDVPDMFYDFFTPVFEVHSHFTRQSCGLFIPTSKTNLGKTCLSYWGPFIWDKIKIRLRINRHIWSCVHDDLKTLCKNWFANWLDYSMYFFISFSIL